MKMESGEERAREGQDSHSEDFATTSQVREKERTSGKQVPGVGSASDAEGNQRKMSAVWASGGGFWEEREEHNWSRQRCQRISTLRSVI